MRHTWPVLLFLAAAPILLFVSHVHAALAGDANGDGRVDGVDYVRWANNYTTTQSGGASAGDFNADGRVDGVDYVIWMNNYGLTDPGGGGDTSGAGITIRHPYQFGAQPALVYENFNLTYWIDNWDVASNGKNIRLLIQKTNPKTVQMDELATPWKNYVQSGYTTYPAATCDTITQTVLDKRYYTKEPIPVSGLVEGGYYKISLELANADNSFSGISTSACIEVNREFLSALVHVNDTSGSGGGGGSPKYFDILKSQISQAQSQLGTIVPCPNHNPVVWHAIYDPVRKCHYDHEHKDDPNRSYFDNPANTGRNGTNRGVGDVLSVFGPVWAWLPEKDKAGLPESQTLSYPWQTWSGVDIGSQPVKGKMENDMKHNGYGWLVRTPDDFGSNSGNCVPLYNTKNCITHFREQYHAVQGMPGALTHTHSFSLEARICVGGGDGKDNSKCGIYRGGGHVGFGMFGTTRWSVTEPGQQELLPFFYTDGPSEARDLDGNGKLDEWDYYYLRPDGTVRGGGIRLHGGMADDDVHASAKDFTWYPEGRPSMIALVGSSFGPLLYTPKGISYNTSRYQLTGPEWSQIRRQVYYCADPTRCRWPNGGQMEAHFVIIRIPNDWDGASFDEDRQKNGYFTFHGYTNRWGDLLTNNQCNTKPLGPDCVPTVYDHTPVDDGDTQHRDSSSGTPMYNYDIAPSGTYWIQFPN